MKVLTDGNDDYKQESSVMDKNWEKHLLFIPLSSQRQHSVNAAVIQRRADLIAAQDDGGHKVTHRRGLSLQNHLFTQCHQLLV